MDGRMERRDFLKQAAGLAIAGATCAAVPRRAESADAPLAIVDPHQHLWDFKESFRPPWLKDAPKMNRSHTMEEYLRETKGHNVIKTVYMEVDLDPKDQVKEAEYVTRICKGGKTPMVAAVVSGRPASPGFKAYVDRFKGNPYIKGVRQILHPDSAPKGLCLRPEFIKSIQLLGEKGLSYDICVRPGELGDAAKLIDACPDTRFILDHCGNAEAQWKDGSKERANWEQGMREVAKRKHVICKVSGVIKTCPEGISKVKTLTPIVNHTIRTFGPDRVMFAGDWPVCTFTASIGEWITTLKTIVKDMPIADQRKLFSENAIKFYGI